MPDSHEPLTIEPRWQRFRYLFSDGHTLDVMSPYNADSTDREAALAEAVRRWKNNPGRTIAGVARTASDGTPLKHVPAKKAPAKKIT